MGQPLDITLIKHLVEDPTAVNSDFVTESIDISGREAEFSVQITWNDGIGVDMLLKMEVSNDNLNFVEVTGLTQQITDDSGSHFMDVGFTGAAYMRIKVEVSAGSITLQDILYKARRRH